MAAWEGCILNKLIFGAGVALAVFVVVPANAQSTKWVNFAGDVSAESMTAVKFVQPEQLRGVRSVIIPQFTVEFVRRSDGLSTKEEKRQEYVSVVYEVGGLAPDAQQALTDKLYARWVAGLTSQGIAVKGPTDALTTKSWAKLGETAKPSPALIGRASGANNIYNVAGAPYLLPVGSSGEVSANGSSMASVETGAVVASKVGGKALGKLGGMFGMAKGLSKLGKGLGRTGDAMKYLSSEQSMAKETGAAVMTVRLVVGLRDTDMATRGFGMFRTAGSYDGKPKFVIQSEGTEVSLTPPDAKARTMLTVPQDLVFREDVLAGKLVVSNSTGQTAANVLSRARFATAVVGGGSATMNQSHTFAATPVTAAYDAAIQRNVVAIEDIFLARLKTAW